MPETEDDESSQSEVDVVERSRGRSDQTDKFALFSAGVFCVKNTCETIDYQKERKRTVLILKKDKADDLEIDKQKQVKNMGSRSSIYSP